MLLNREELARIREARGTDPVVQRLTSELDTLRRELTDVRANLEALLLAWRDRAADEHPSQEFYSTVEAVVERMRALSTGDLEPESRERVVDALEEIQDDFERGG